MAFVVLCVWLLYLVLLVVMYIGLRKALALPLPEVQTETTVTVILPVRNEAHRLPLILPDLLKQTYAPGKWQVIIVDDHSEDTTGEILQAYATQAPEVIQCYSLSDNVQGKKAALALGITHARGEVILTTDADCRMEPNWLARMTSWFSDPNVHMVCGPVRIAKANLYSELQQLEFAALIGTTAAFLGLGKPLMCNGANLAYRARLFKEVNGFAGNDHLASGDDEFLMRKIQKHAPGSIRFANHSEAVVTSEPQRTLNALVHQRVRWASKWKAHGISYSGAMAVLIFVFNAVLLLSPVWIFTWVLGFASLGMLWLVKAGLEALVVNRICLFLRLRFPVHVFMLLQLIYPLYVVFFGLISNALTAVWKGRTLSAR
jgi:cellulose synthase/poly-beta-1,6-N-acetylglucosamine synthase-like glycosyltransferase